MKERAAGGPPVQCLPFRSGRICAGSSPPFCKKPETVPEPWPVVVPHAGLCIRVPWRRVFCLDSLPKRVILLGPNHTGRGAGLALSPPGSWAPRPWAQSSVDAEMNRELPRRNAPGLQEDASSSRQGAFAGVRSLSSRRCSLISGFPRSVSEQMITPRWKRWDMAWLGPLNP